MTARKPKRQLAFQISTAENVQMKSYDMLLQMGGFVDRKEAEDAARVIVQFLEDNCNAWSARVQ